MREGGVWGGGGGRTCGRRTQCAFVCEAVVSLRPKGTPSRTGTGLAALLGGGGGFL